MLFIETDMISLAGRKEVATVESENWAFSQSQYGTRL